MDLDIRETPVLLVLSIQTETEEILRILLAKAKVVGVDIEGERDVHYLRGEDLVKLNRLKDDVPENSLAIARARQTNKEGYADKLRASNTEATEEEKLFFGAVKTTSETSQEV